MSQIIFGRILSLPTKKEPSLEIIDRTKERYSLDLAATHYFQVGDIILVDPENDFYLVQPPRDQETMERDLFRVFKSKFVVNEAKRRLNSLGIKTSDQLDLASCYYQQKLTHLDRLSDLMNWWYQHRCWRKIKLLRLNLMETDILELEPTIDHFIRRVLSRPLETPLIPLDYALKLHRILRKPYNEKELYAAKVVRLLWRKINRKQETIIPWKQVLKDFPDIPSIIDLFKNYDLILTKQQLAIEPIYRIEKYLAETLVKLNRKKIKVINQSLLEQILLESPCNQQQAETIKIALSQPLTIITGEAGTGKTTLIKYIVQYLKLTCTKYLLTSFTGKAVSRLKEIIPKAAAYNLDLYLKAPFELGDNWYLIVDEISMVRTGLLYRFFRLYPIEKYRYQVILVGDANQLKPIGWGNFFQYIIQESLWPVIRLQQNYRQGESGIRTNATRIIDGLMLEPTSDVQLYFQEISPLEIIQAKRIPHRRVKVITPCRREMHYFNRLLQSYYRENDEGIEIGENVWKRRDQVMMLVNNHLNGVMNGDEGEIISVNPEKSSIKVLFGSTQISFREAPKGWEKLLELYPPGKNAYIDLDQLHITYYPGKKFVLNNLISERSDYLQASVLFIKEYFEGLTCPLSHLSLSYAITIHKSQGSEWDIVIAYLPQRLLNHSFINRNSLYTMITRAKYQLYCIGEKEVWQEAISRKEELPRESFPRLV